MVSSFIASQVSLVSRLLLACSLITCPAFCIASEVGWDLGTKLQSNYAYTLDSEVANIEVSMRQCIGGCDFQFMVWSFKVISNVVTPVLFTLALQEEM